MSEIQISALDGSFFNGYAAAPTRNNGPGVVLVHGIWGLNSTIKTMCDELAADGYIAICPDLFARQKKGLLTQSSQELDGTQAADFYKNFDINAGLRDLLATISHLRQKIGCGGKVGALGYGLGGRLAFFLSARSDIHCAIGYDNMGLESMLGEAHDINAPILLHFGEQDPFMPASTRNKIISRLKNHTHIQTRTYPAAGHGFYQKESTKFHPDGAKQAQEATSAFLRKHLKG